MIWQASIVGVVKTYIHLVVVCNDKLLHVVFPFSARFLVTGRAVNVSTL